MFAYKIGEAFRGSKDMPHITDFLPLDYDYELEDQPETIEALYNRVSSQWN